MDVKTFRAYYEKETGWWIPISEINVLFHVDLDGTSEIVGSFQGYTKTDGWIVSNIIAIDEAILFFSRTEFLVWKYIREERKLEKIRYSELPVNMISSVVRMDDAVWVFPNRLIAPIMVISLQDMSVTEFAWKCDADLEDSLITRPVVDFHKIYFATRKQSRIKIGCINTETKSIEYIDMPLIKYINCIDVKDNIICALCRDEWGKTLLVKMDVMGNLLDNIDISESVELWDSTRNRYFKMVERDGYIFLFGNADYMVKLLNVSTGKVDDIKDVIGPYYGKDELDIVRNDIQLWENFVYIFSPELGRIQVLDMSKKILRSVSITLKESFDDAMKVVLKEGMKEAMLSSNNLLMETPMLTLDSFLEVVVDEV